jgi:hypothetical protein
MIHGLVLFWVLPVRLFHCLLAMSFAFAYLTGDWELLGDVLQYLMSVK